MTLVRVEFTGKFHAFWCFLEVQFKIKGSSSGGVRLFLLWIYQEQFLSEKMIHFRYKMSTELKCKMSANESVVTANCAEKDIIAVAFVLLFL